MDGITNHSVVANETQPIGLFLRFSYIPSFVYRELVVTYQLTGVVFNIILITYFIRLRKYQSPTFMLLTSLAFIDLISCLSVASWAAFLMPTMPIPDLGLGCPIFIFVGIAAAYSSEYHLVFFAVLRFYQLGFPLAAMAKITSTLVLKVCLVITIMVTIYMMPLGIMYGAKPVIMDGKRVTICTLSGGRFAYDVAYLILNTIVPCLAIIGMHIAKYIVVWRSRSSIVSEQQIRQNADARAVTIIIILFFLTWLPASIYANVQHTRIENYRKMRDSLYLICMYVSLSNSTLNPLVYCFAAKTVRDDILKLLRRTRYK